LEAKHLAQLFRKEILAVQISPDIILARDQARTLTSALSRAALRDIAFMASNQDCKKYLCIPVLASAHGRDHVELEQNISREPECPACLIRLAFAHLPVLLRLTAKVHEHRLGIITCTIVCTAGWVFLHLYISY